MAFVMDASLALCLIMNDETTIKADEILDLLDTGRALVPPIWNFEVRNALLVGMRKGRIDQADISAKLTDLSRLPIDVDPTPNHDRTLELAIQHGLTQYDASYLELAIRHRAPLLTLDKALAKAADNEEVLATL